MNLNIALTKYNEFNEREKCEENLYDFLKASWRYIDPAPFIGGWHLQAIAEHLQAVTDGQIKRLILNVPPRSSKSSICSVAWPAWTWAQSRKGPCSGPQVQFLSASYSHNLSLRDSVKTRRLIESPWYKKHWGHKFSMTSDVNTKGRFENDKGGYRLATSVDGALTGEGGQVILCFPYDEIVDTEKGFMKIGDIVEKDIDVKVLSYGDNRFSYKGILKRYQNPQSEILKILLSDRTSLKCTPNHKFLTDRGWMEARSLLGFRILSGDSLQYLTVQGVHFDGHVDKTYCLEVEDNHTFCVGISSMVCSNCDDPHNVTEVESDLIMQATRTWWDESMQTRLNDPNTGAFVIIMQRVHTEDLTGHIISKENNGYTWLMLPMHHDKSRHCVTYVSGQKFFEDPRKEEGELLCPERFNERALKQLTQNMTPFSVAGQLEQAPVPRGGGIIKEEWWREWTDPAYPVFDYILASLDTAYTEKEENDASALTLWGIFKDKNENPKIMLIYGWEGHLAMHELVERVMATCTTHALPNNHKYKHSQRFRVDRLLIESKASGISVYQELQRLYAFQGHFGVELFNPTKLGDKEARVHAVSHLFYEGLIHIPWPAKDGKALDAPYKWAEPILKQVTNFPRSSRKDFVDSMSMALRWLRDSGLLVRTEEHAEQTHETMVYRGRNTPLYPI